MMINDDRPRRVRVTGDYFHGQVPSGSVYVGRHAPGLAGSKYANPFRAARMMPRAHPLRPYLDAAARLAGMTAEELAGPANDILRPETRQVAATAFWYWFREQPDLIATATADLAGVDLACWCPKPQAGPDWCHAFALLLRANGPSVAIPRQLARAGEW
jgi:hypothetical protein